LRKQMAAAGRGGQACPMGKTLLELDEPLTEFIRRQRLFFVATAPSAADGHVNVSPKGYDTLRVLGPREVAYLDLTGSGAETVAHLRDNGRITLLFCALEGKPQLVRLHGRGEALRPGAAGFDRLAPLFPARRGARAIVRIDVERVSTSCGYSVPLFTYVRERPTLDEWTDRKSDAQLDEYHRQHNACSIDGLPALAD
jgi:predicted pyridoxine 5'-phosphate oxidase superfamily flavin-nucleotide-binding protein